jgi:hypothetical protein
MTRLYPDQFARSRWAQILIDTGWSPVHRHLSKDSVAWLQRYARGERE